METLIKILGEIASPASDPGEYLIRLGAAAAAQPRLARWLRWIRSACEGRNPLDVVTAAVACAADGSARFIGDFQPIACRMSREAAHLHAAANDLEADVRRIVREEQLRMLSCLELRQLLRDRGIRPRVTESREALITRYLKLEGGDF